MKALTIWQPWASLIMAGAKPYEFRSYPAPRFVQGQRIVIHAGVRPVKVVEVRALLVKLHSARAWETGLDPEKAIPLLERVRNQPGILPLGSGLGTAVLGKPVDPRTFNAGRINDSDRMEHVNWAWPLSDIQPFEPPIPAKGARGFWEWSGA